MIQTGHSQCQSHVFIIIVEMTLPPRLFFENSSIYRGSIGVVTFEYFYTYMLSCKLSWQGIKALEGFTSIFIPSGGSIRLESTGF
jgi:hypothetical protein